MPENKIDYKLLSLISPEQAHTLRVVPFRKEENTLHFYASQKSAGVEEIALLTGERVQMHYLEAVEISRLLHTHFPRTSHHTKGKIGQVSVDHLDSDVVKFIDKIFKEAVNVSASDIHIERYEAHARVRYRWEGQLIEKYEIDVSKYNAIISRIKIMSELDISERRLPQDGRINLAYADQKIDIRVSTIPGKFGEKVVMRLLHRSPSFLQLSNLGMQERAMKTYLRAIKQHNGIVLITGPTGSGKTTTLYASLNLLNDPTKNIITIEDPIEYNLDGINQVQVKEEIGLSFSRALRAFLRQDPDIIMVGEIRDTPTAEIAIRSSLTGHLVLSTLHTNSALDAVGRLVDMGIPPYLISATVRLIVAQRLIRILCPVCRKMERIRSNQELLEELDISICGQPVGCEQCNYTGYHRRRAIYELLPMGDELTKKIKLGDMEKNQLSRIVPGYRSLREEALELLKSGETSLDEAMSYLI